MSESAIYIILIYTNTLTCKIKSKLDTYDFAMQDRVAEGHTKGRRQCDFDTQPEQRGNKMITGVPSLLRDPTRGRLQDAVSVAARNNDTEIRLSLKSQLGGKPPNPP